MSTPTLTSVTFVTGEAEGAPPAQARDSLEARVDRLEAEVRSLRELLTRNG